jgi:hypothetical protein
MDVFVGPTLRAAEVTAQLDAVVHGPASFGDVCRAARERPTAIAIVDGTFERAPAVWHKEILWAMSEGVHVFGASSMGALRAAELADFGMVGVGSVFEAYRSGALEDDDEVAVAHGDAEQDFHALSEAMVTLRATVRAARDAGVVTAATSEVLEAAAKARFYADRGFAAMLRDAADEGADARELEAFRDWLPSGRVDPKRDDALLLLSHLREWAATRPAPKRVGYRFERTDAWHAAADMALATFSPSAASGADSDAPWGHDALVEELKLAGHYASSIAGAAARAAAVEDARRAGASPDAAAIRMAIAELRREQGLLDRAQFDRWRVEQRLGDAELARLLEDEARRLWARPMHEAAAREHLVSHLRATGEYGRFAERAETKASRLRALGPLAPSLEDLAMTEGALFRWYFLERRQTSVPDDVDGFARRAGFADRSEMRAAVLRELQCVHLETRALPQRSEAG